MRKEKEQSTSYKTYAKEAKKRLAGGFWDEIRQNEGKYTKEQVRNRIYSKTYEEDEAFYRQVCEILSSPEVISNPIYRLADKKILAKADADTKEKYLARLRERYMQMSLRYEKEKQEKENNGNKN